MRPSNRPTPARAWLLVIVVASLVLFGLSMVLSATSVQSFAELGSPWAQFRRQALWTGLGVVAFVVAGAVDHRRLRRLHAVGLVVALALNLGVLVPGLGATINGATAWYRFGPMQFQPSELLKLALLVYTAELLTRREHVLHQPRAVLWPPLMMLTASAVLLLTQRDLGTAVVVTVCVLSVLFIGGVPLGPLCSASAAMVAAGCVFIAIEPYRRARILAYLNPWANADGAAYQTLQGMVSLATGGGLGLGLGESRQKWGFLPYAHTDFIFAVIGEELGFLGVMVVLGLFGAFGVLGLRIARGAADRFGMLLAGGITAWICTQALVNLGAVAGLLPVTGLTLPFISFGGTSLVVTMAAAGVLLNIARTGR